MAILASKPPLYQIIYYNKREVFIWGYRAIANNSDTDSSATTDGLSDNVGISHRRVRERKTSTQ